MKLPRHGLVPLAYLLGMAWTCPRGGRPGRAHTVRRKLEHVIALLKIPRGSHPPRRKTESFQGPSKSQDLHPTPLISLTSPPPTLQLSLCSSPTGLLAAPWTVSSHLPQDLCTCKSLCVDCCPLRSQPSSLAHLLQDCALISPWQVLP